MAWKLKFPRASYRLGDDKIELELEPYPKLKLIRAPKEGKRVSLAKWSIEPWPLDSDRSRSMLPCSDAFVRDQDAIAAFAQASPWNFGYQVDFRVHECLEKSFHGIEIWLSIQTSLLESNPQLRLASGRGEPHWSEGEIALADHGQAAVMIHPLDRVDCIARKNRARHLQHWEFFGGFMEKGVIRRARVLLAWCDPSVESPSWNTILEKFASAPLPLTA